MGVRERVLTRKGVGWNGMVKGTAEPRCGYIAAREFIVLRRTPLKDSCKTKREKERKNFHYPEDLERGSACAFLRRVSSSTIFHNIMSYTDLIRKRSMGGASS